MRLFFALVVFGFSGPALAEDGSALFAAKGCVACHHATKDQSKFGLGPSLTMVASAYADDTAGLVKFLAADPAATPRVLPDKYPLMKAQQAMSKTWSSEEKTAVAAFILGHKP